MSAPPSHTRSSVPCRLIGLNPVAYLGSVLPDLARGIEFERLACFMPKTWKLAHPQAALPPLR